MSFVVDGHEFILRPARLRDEQERNLLIATWLRTYANDSAFARAVDRRQVFDFHEVIVKRLLETCSVRVVQPIEVETSVLAWICDDGDTLHYVCCKKDQYKRLGFASQLMAGRTYRQHTHRTDEWARSGIRAGEYMPYVALLGKEAA